MKIKARFLVIGIPLLIVSFAILAIVAANRAQSIINEDKVESNNNLVDAKASL